MSQDPSSNWADNDPKLYTETFAGAQKRTAKNTSEKPDPCPLYQKGVCSKKARDCTQGGHYCEGCGKWGHPWIHCRGRKKDKSGSSKPEKQS